MYKRPIGFDVWWVDKDGNIQALTKNIDLYVYLCKEERYPKELNNIKIIPHAPKHLPPQRSIIMKWIRNSISFNELKCELGERYKSIYSMKEIIGTANERNRHIRIDISDEKEYKEILNSGKITIYGQLYDIDEYLPAPKLLICTKCNLPVTELRKRTDLLPANTQIYIPFECRPSGENNKVIENKTTFMQHQQYQQNPHQFNIMKEDYNTWPILQHNVSNQSASTSTNNTNIYDTIQTLKDELEKIKTNYAEEQRRNQQKYSEILILINQSYTIMKQQIDTQVQMITAMNNIIGTTMFTTCSKVEKIIKTTQNQLAIINNEEETYLSHQALLQQLVDKQKVTLDYVMNALTQHQPQNEY
ncbi:unnamed protein product [Rotaria sp. Silwood1]|nr:unnamed protein product [Rotaria sp. Silwood1]CAF4724518.1 unnamed protein product [Rotaria sp. Silwood1]